MGMKKKEIQRIEKRLQTIEKELEKVRNYSAQVDGWQTQRFAKKSRKYDYLAMEKFELRSKLLDLNLGYGLAIGHDVKDYNGFELKIVDIDEYNVYCNFEENEGDVLEYKYYELTRI